MRRALAFALVAGFPLVASAQVTRTEVIERAKDYVFYPWHASTANLSASCHANYESFYVEGDFLGVAYDWGGFDSLYQFSQKIGAGQGAGSPAGGLVTSCTTGVDCSGFVSRTWKTASKYGTSTIDQISSVITTAQLLPGDILNDAGNHVTLFSHLLGNGEPYMYEAAFTNAHINATGGWSWVNGYIPRRYQSISGTTVANPTGTLSNPIVITSLPFTDSRDTRTAPSSVLDGCVLTTTNESGPELVYRIDITSPGQLTVAVSDDATADIDVHLATSWNTNDCIARHDASFTKAVDCGTYYIIADTYGGSANAGAFDLTVSEVPSGQPCGSGPPTYQPHGGLGEACSFPGNPNLPSCNPTLGGDVCLYGSSSSFCSTPCATNTDCASMPGGGCCEDIGNNEYYCMTSSYCGGGSGSNDPVGPGGGSGSGSGSGSGGGGEGDPGGPGGDDTSDPGGCAAAPSGSLVLGVMWLAGLVLGRRRAPRVTRA